MCREHSGAGQGRGVDARPRYWGVSSREQHRPVPLMTHLLLGEGGLNWARTPEGMINGRLMGWAREQTRPGSGAKIGKTLGLSGRGEDQG